MKEIDRQIREIKEKYGMSYKEFYNRVEGEISPLLERFDIEEIMDDLQRLITLLDEKERLLRKLGKDVNLLAELDEDWIKIFP